MKLAEALIARADLQRRAAKVADRLHKSARVQDGEEPAEPPKTLLQELNAIYDELERLIQRINRTNVSIELEPGVTVADALATRDVLGMRRAAYQTLADRASVRQDRLTRSEVKFISSVEVAAIQRQADDYAKAYRTLDTAIQAINWQTDLV